MGGNPADAILLLFSAGDIMSSSHLELDDEIIGVEEAEVADGELVAESTEGQTDYDNVWDKLAAVKIERANLRVLVVDASKGGLVVDLGVRAFIPKSEIATRHLGNLERYIGSTLEVKVTEVDRENGRVVLSHRHAVEEKRAARRAKTLAALERGETVEGVVRRITDFGAFVDIGGVDGLLHVSDMAWDTVKHPQDVVQVGDKVTVKVLKIEADSERISLGLKQLTDDPWRVARRDLKEGDIVEVEILRMADLGAVARVLPGIDGIIPEKEMSNRRRGDDGAPVTLEPGQKVMVKIIELHYHDRRVTLSIRKAEFDKERSEVRDFMRQQRTATTSVTPTLGDLFGDVLSKFPTKGE
jgi:small subunit ribosomal protein S1